MEDLVSKIIELTKNNNLGSEERILKIEALIEEKLRHDPNNIELLMRLAVLELNPPVADHNKSIEILEKVLSIDKNNIIALLLLAYVKYHCSGGVDKDLLDKLDSIKTNDKELLSMAKYAAYWHYSNNDEFNDEKKQEQYLLESINLYGGHVCNYVDLVELYLQQGKKEKAKELVEIALKNVVKIYTENVHIEDISDINEFLDERIKGICITDSIVAWIERLNKKAEILLKK